MAQVINHSFSGKLGQLVGFNWNGNGYIKIYTKPRNPRTPGQTAHRLVFGKINRIARDIYRCILKPYTFPKPYPERNSSYNRMMSVNRLLLSNNEWDPANLKIFEGPLENPGISSVVLAGNTVTLFFDAVPGKDKDAAIAVVYDDAAAAVFYAVGTRNAGFVKVSVSPMAGQNAASLHAYLVFSRSPAVNAAKNYRGFNKSEFKGLVSTTAYKKIA